MKSNKLLLHPDFKKALSDINKINPILIQKPSIEKSFFPDDHFCKTPKLSLVGDDFLPIDLNASLGNEINKKYYFSAYDESKLRYNALEGIALFTSHSIVLSDKSQYLPVAYLTLHFYTGSREVANIAQSVKHTDDFTTDSNKDYIEERNSLITEYCLENTILFIDGPLLGGNYSHYTIQLVKRLHEKNIIPIFIVKNSDSNLVIDNIELLKGKYNSDLHWAYVMLKMGQRTNYFTYVDADNKENTKVFCYVKVLNQSPQRVELHPDTMLLYKDNIDEIMHLIYYLYLLNGDKTNPQIRPIVIAEIYAREILKILNVERMIRYSGLTPTVNQKRFGG